MYMYMYVLFQKLEGLEQQKFVKVIETLIITCKEFSKHVVLLKYQ